ncbi:MAG TPA: hypothetical protein VMG12_25280 [Polyangiaceae bacterium]|nr:hypothetical protein [Polyangiaceae bacterium]
MPAAFLPRRVVSACALVLAFQAVSCDSSKTPPSLVGGGGSSQDPGTNGGNSGGGAEGKSGTQGVIWPGGEGDPDDPPSGAGLTVAPDAAQTLLVTQGQALPNVVFTATLGGKPVNAAWSIDRGELGRITPALADTATFTPTGDFAGTVTVRAGLNGTILEREVHIRIAADQNGPSAADAAQVAEDVGELTSGGGIGGVGGEGLGAAVSDAATLAALRTPAGNGQAQGLAFSYPYDGTVFPRGILAPLIMWDWATHDADAISMHLETTSGSFSWTGVFGRPAILAQTHGAFVRHPIPQDVWEAASASVGGTSDSGPDRLVLSLVVARNGQAYGPISQTWTVAPARLSGTIYYNSYGSQLAKNEGDAVGGDHQFGGAVLSIKVGDTGPRLTAGSNGGTSACRTCHSVAAGGSRLVVQHGNAYASSSAYDLDAAGGASETSMANGARFPALTRDGDKALSPSGQLLALPAGDVLPATGLATAFTNLGTPMFSPDSSLVAFNPMAGSGVTNPTQKLVVMKFDDATNAFTDPVVVVDGTGRPAAERPGWPAFLPDGRSVVFQQQVAAGGDGNGDGALYTRRGAKAQIHWASASGSTVTPLDKLNGVGYLPHLESPPAVSCTADGQTVGTIDPGHAEDHLTNYEPTVNPVASGGYSWVIFTSRRLYGNVATIPPFCSDPRGVDLVQNITTKKLWVAAVDVNGQPGSDASHPAFYLPAQELLAGNSRAFWVLDPCRADGASCETGDQCCNGYCQPGAGDALVCVNQPPAASCSMVQERCEKAADCCDSSNVCVGGFCVLSGPR